MRDSVTLDGKEPIQRSGLNSNESSPHTVLLILLERIAITMVVPAGTATSFMDVPSTPIIGWEKGINMSFWALIKPVFKLVSKGQNRKD